MTPPHEPISLILTGPTGIGKTALAVELAKHRPFELISADSMQVYRGMEIGTAQPTPEELQGVPIHGCGFQNPREPFSAKRFLDFSDRTHAEILSRGKIPLYVGGTGLYLRSIRWGLFDETEPENESSAEQSSRKDQIRKRLERELEELGAPILHNRLAEIDPPSAARIAPNDRVRIVRALQVAEITGRPISTLHREWATPKARFPHLVVALTCPRAELVRRIEQRVDAMLAQGWIEEVRALIESGCDPSFHCFKALGYREIAAHLVGDLSRDELRTVISARTRQFSKRQMTWFRRERDIHWVNLDPEISGRELAQIEKLLETSRADF